MIQKKFEEQVRKEFPQIGWESSEFIESGWDHYILILDGRLVFRKPKDSRYTEIFVNELRFMKYIKDFTSTTIPEYKYIAKDGSFAGYPIIPGASLDREMFNSMSEDQIDSLAEQIGSFLTDIHKVPVSVKQEFGIKDSDYSGDFNDMQRKAERMLYSKLSTEEVDEIKKFFSEYREMLSEVKCDTFLHNDLGGEHILFDEKTGKIGVIDFSDREFGDPAFDFTGMIEFGEDFTQKVIDHYTGKKDNGFLYRAKMYFKRIPVMLMIDSMEGFPCTFEDGYEMMKEYWNEE